jgi:DNA-binding cell septation regulator SpoVG
LRLGVLAMSAPIEVLAIRRLDGSSTVKAFVDFRLGGVTIKGAKIVQQTGQKAWVAMPAVKSGRGRNNVIELSKPLRERVTEVVLVAWATQQPRSDSGQVDTGEVGRPFDDRIPF